MRVDNVVLATICLAAIAGASTIAWRGRRLPIVGPPIVRSARASALDALRSVACVFSAAVIAGFLVVGLGGRLVMRILAATSGDSAQGLLTDARERVGEITFGGTAAFVVFVGLGFSVVASLAYLVLRRLLPQPAWIAGIAFGILVLATFGVSDPLSPENVDFVILAPRWFAIALIAATALLFGMTFTALAARLDRAVPALSGPAPDASTAGRFAYCSLIFMLIPFIAVPALVYVGLRTVCGGRVGILLARDPIRVVGHAVLAVLVVVSIGSIVNASVQIL